MQYILCKVWLLPLNLLSIVLVHRILFFLNIYFKVFWRALRYSLTFSVGRVSPKKSDTDLVGKPLRGGFTLWLTYLFVLFSPAKEGNICLVLKQTSSEHGNIIHGILGFFNARQYNQCMVFRSLFPALKNISWWIKSIKVGFF